MTQILALIDVTVAPDKRAEAQAILDIDAAEAREMPGNVAFDVLTDPHAPGRLRLEHGWSDAASFEGYLASDAFARALAGLKPLMIAPPISQRLVTTLYAPDA